MAKTLLRSPFPSYFHSSLYSSSYGVLVHCPTAIVTSAATFAAIQEGHLIRRGGGVSIQYFENLKLNRAGIFDAYMRVFPPLILLLIGVLIHP